MTRRLLIAATAIVLTVVLVRFSDPHSVAQPEPSPIVGPANFEDKTGSTWFCPLGSAPIGDPAAGGIAAPQNLLDIAAVSAVSARITVFRTAPDEAGESTVVSDIDLGAGELVTVDATAMGDGGATVEIRGGQATVAQRLVADNRSDQLDCLNEAGDAAYYASARTDEGAAAQLWLVNPFPTDASVDLRITGDDGVRQPGPFRGIIVAAHSSRLVDLSTPGGAELRDQVAVAVEARSGRIVSGLAQTVGGRGLRTTPGVQRAAETWVIPYSFTGADVDEKLWLYNPSDSDASVLVSAIPQGVPPEMLPEPFVREVPARRYAVIDLPAEGRLPAQDLRWLQIEELSGVGIVANHVVSLSAAGGDGVANTRPSVAAGLAAQVGTTVQATSWTISSLDPGSVGQSVVAISNPSPDAIAVVSITRTAREGGGDPQIVVENQEISPLGTLAFDISELADARISVRVDASSPVTVSGRTTNTSAADMAMWSALSVAETSSPVASIGG